MHTDKAFINESFIGCRNNVFRRRTLIEIPTRKNLSDAAMSVARRQAE